MENCLFQYASIMYKDCPPSIVQGVSKVTPDFIQLKSQWIFFYDIFYIYAFSNHLYCYVVILCSYTTYQKYKFVL